MLLKKEPLGEVDVAWSEDQLGRKKVAEYLTPIIGSVRQPFVIALNSPYGTGKTFFIKNWKRQLEQDGYKAVYFNAWETDYSDDALIAFISSIREQLHDKKSAKKLAELAKTGGAYLTRKVLPVVAKGVARKVIGAEAVEEIIDLSSTTDEELVDFFGDVAEDSLRKHEAIKTSVFAFRDYLADLVEDLTKKADGDDKKKLVIFVDELDRCRPTYSIEVLECIKHLFSVNGVLFIMAIDEEQLRSSIASVYGTKLNGESYLRKFIDWRLALPKPSSLQYATYLYEAFNLDETNRLGQGRAIDNGKASLINSFGVFSNGFELTLREQAQCFTEINLCIRSLVGNEDPETFLSGLMPVLRLRHSDKLKDCLEGKFNPEELTDLIMSKLDVRVVEEAFGQNWAHIRKFIHAFFVNDNFYEKLKSELNDLTNKQKAVGVGGLPPNIQQRHEYIHNVVETCEYLRKGSYYSWYQSPARTVYNRFEKASQITGR